MPSASSVSAACFMVGQSDWLPMMIATGFPVIDPLESAARKAGDYRDGPWGGKAAHERPGNRPLRSFRGKNERIVGQGCAPEPVGALSLSFDNDLRDCCAANRG